MRQKFSLSGYTNEYSRDEDLLRLRRREIPKDADRIMIRRSWAHPDDKRLMYRITGYTEKRWWTRLWYGWVMRRWGVINAFGTIVAIIIFVALAIFVVYGASALLDALEIAYRHSGEAMFW